MLRNALGTLLAGAAILMILCVASFGVSGLRQQSSDFSARMASYRNSGEPRDRALDPATDPNRQSPTFADGTQQSNERRDVRTATKFDEFGSNGSANLPRVNAPDDLIDPPRSERELDKLPPLPPVDSVAHGRLERLETQLDRVLDGVLNQARNDGSADRAVSSQTQAQIAELRIQNQVELRDMQRRLQLLAEQQDRLNASMQTQRVDFARTLAATDESISKHIDRLVNTIPQRTAYMVPIGNFAGQYPDMGHAGNNACSDQQCPHCRRPKDLPVPPPRDADASSDVDLRSANRTWTKSTPSGAAGTLAVPGTHDSGSSRPQPQLNREPNTSVHEQLESHEERPVPPPKSLKSEEPAQSESPAPAPAPAPSPSPIPRLVDDLSNQEDSRNEPTRREPLRQEAPIEQQPEPRIATDPESSSTSFIETPRDNSIRSLAQARVVDATPAANHRAEATYVPRLDLPELSEPVAAPGVETIDDFVSAPGNIFAGLSESDRSHSARLEPTRIGPARQPLKIRMSVMHVTSNDVNQTLPAGVFTLQDFARKYGGWSNGDHDAKAAELETAMAATRVVQFVTSAETGFVRDAARFAIGSQCLHCVTEHGIMGLDRLVVQKQREAATGTELSLGGQSIKGDVLATLPDSSLLVNAGDHFVFTEAAQNGFVAVHQDTKLSRLPLIGKRFRKETVEHSVIQRVILLSVTHDDVTPNLSKAPEITPRQEPARLSFDDRRNSAVLKAPDLQASRSGRLHSSMPSEDFEAGPVYAER